MTPATCALGTTDQGILEKIVQQHIGQICAIGKHDRKAQKHGNKIPIVAPSEAVHHPDAVMVMFCNTNFADTAMLAPRRFDKLTSPTDLTRPKQYMVVGILPHLPGVVLCRDHRRSGHHAFVGEHVGKRNNEDSCEAVNEAKPSPGRRYKYVFSDYKQTHVKDLWPQSVNSANREHSYGILEQVGGCHS